MQLVQDNENKPFAKLNFFLGTLQILFHEH